MHKINIYTVAADTSIAEFTKETFKEEKYIKFAGYFNTFNGVTKFVKNRPSKEPAIFFVNDHSFKKDDALNFLNETVEQTILEKYKKILHTGSFDKSYINKLSFSNINGILHKQDTPLFIEQNRNITNLPTLKQAKERFIKILKLVNEGCTFLDREITNMLPRRYAWARGSDDFVSDHKTFEEKRNASCEFDQHTSANI